MVQGLKFLSKKGFNPANKANQKRVWEAEQEKKTQAVRIQEREAQLRREREDEELARARGLEPKLGFLYTPPPGLEGSAAGSSSANNKQSVPDAGANNYSETTSTARDLSTQRQPGDDDAAAAFRQLLAQGTAASFTAASVSDVQQVQTNPKSAFGSTVLKGSSAPNEAKKIQLSALEKAVGRKKDTSALTLDEQIQRFPALANAPRAKGMTATDVGASFKPLGTQIRNVKCLACGIWGHSRGDRECELSGWNPFAVKAGTGTAVAAAAASEEVSGKLDSPPSPRNSASSMDGDKKGRKKKRRQEVYSYSDEDSSVSSYRSGRRYEKDDDSSYERARKRKHKKRKKKRERRSRSPSNRKHKSSSKRNKEDREERRRKHRSRRDVR